MEITSVKLRCCHRLWAGTGLYERQCERWATTRYANQAYCVQHNPDPEHTKKREAARRLLNRLFGKF